MKKIKCLVTGAGGGVGQGIIKSLDAIQDLEIEVVAADMSALACGLYFSNQRILVPPAHDPDYSSAIAEILKRMSVDFYIPGTDVELKVCLDNYSEIEALSGSRVLVVRGEAVYVGDDKFETAEYLKQKGFPFPKTAILEKLSDINVFTLPVIIKPRVGCRSIGVSVAKSLDDVKDRLAECQPLIVQELIGDADNEFTCTVVVCRGKIIGSLILKRVLRAGDTFRAEPINNSVIKEYVEAVALSLSVEGSVNFQLRLDCEGVPKIFEINPRFSGTTPFCTLLGFNPVEAYIKSYLGIGYDYSVDYEMLVLRHWQEVVVPRTVVTHIEQQYE